MRTTDVSGVAARLASVTVREVMHEGLITCAPKTPLDELAHLMASRRIHAILTTDDGDEQKTWGVVSDLDLVSLASADMFGATAADASTTEVITVALDETVERAAQLMSEHGVTHLLVLDGESERPVGVLSTLDVARVIAGHRRNSAPAVHVADVMQTEVVTVAPSTGLQEVARTLAEHGISGVPVVTEGQVVGVVSEGDLLEKQRVHEPSADGLLGFLLGSDLDIEKHWARTAAEAMSSPATTIEPWRSVSAAASIMAENRIKRLPVVHEGRLVGIVSRADIIRAFARSDADIKRDIREEIVLRSFWIDPAEVEIAVVTGEVTISGSVESTGIVESLAAAVATVPGVVSVESNQTVRT